MLRMWLLILMVVLALWGCAAAPRTEAPVVVAPVASADRVALWVSRWDFQSSVDVERIMDNAVSIGVTDVLWQARGTFDAYYESSIEPWGESLLGYDSSGGAPSFDPLRDAVEAARARGMRLHAWVNVFSLWRGEAAPIDRSHALLAEPSWRVYDQTGKAQPPGAGYVWANVTMDPVHDRVVAVLSEIVSGYDVDGLHLDQFHAGVVDSGGRFFPGDSDTLEMFGRATGRRSLSKPRDVEAYRGWLRDRVTRLARRVRAEVAPRSTGVEVSVSTAPRPEVAREMALQDAAAWLASGAIDRVYPRGRGVDAQAWSDQASAAFAAGVTPGVAMGSVVDETQILARLRESAGPGGVGLFAYAAIFDSADPAQPQTPGAVTDRLVRRQTLREWAGARAP